MKFIPYRNYGGKLPQTRDVILLVATQGQHVNGGLKADEVQRRVRIIKAVTSSAADESGLKLEDADHDHLVRLVNEFPFLAATIEIGQIIQDINDAGAAPTTPVARAREAEPRLSRKRRRK